MHQEAVFQGAGALNRPVLPIDILHAQLLETIAWIDADAATLVACLDRFDEAFHSGKANVEAELRQRFNI